VIVHDTEGNKLTTVVVGLVGFFTEKVSRVMVITSQ